MLRLLLGTGLFSDVASECSSCYQGGTLRIAWMRPVHVWVQATSATWKPCTSWSALTLAAGQVSSDATAAQAEYPWAIISERDGGLYCTCKYCTEEADPKQSKKAAFSRLPGVQLKDSRSAITKQLRGHESKDGHKKAASACAARAATDATSSPELTSLEDSSAAERHAKQTTVNGHEDVKVFLTTC